MFLLSTRKVDSEVHCVDDWWSLLGLTKSRLQRYLWLVSVETLPVHREVLCWNLRSLRLIPVLEWVLGIRSLFLTILLYHLQMGIWIHHLFVWSILLSRWFVEDKSQMQRIFPNLPDLLSVGLLSRFLPRLTHSQVSFLITRSFQIDEFLLGLLEKSDAIQLVLQTILLDLWMFLQIVFHNELSNLSRGLGHVADSNSIPWNRIISFHPVLTVAILLKYLLLLVERLFQRCHLSRIDETLKWIQDKFTCLAKFHRVDCIYNFRTVRRIQEFWQTSLRLMWRLRFTRIRLNPMSIKILYHDSMPEIVS